MKGFKQFIKAKYKPLLLVISGLLIIIISFQLLKGVFAFIVFLFGLGVIVIGSIPIYYWFKHKRSGYL